VHRPNTFQCTNVNGNNLKLEVEESCAN
jgi:hypothetical protein